MESSSVSLDKQVAALGMTWETAYGYAQAVRVKNAVYVSGQLSHDDAGSLVGVAASDDVSAASLEACMKLQMRTAYANAAKVLAQVGAGLRHVVEEVLYVTDMDAAFAVAGPVRKAAYNSGRPECASTIVQVERLAFPEQLVEIRLTAVLPD
jgi:enamine deaminase RidA (YjgF/YER057c/UK114 family)